MADDVLIQNQSETWTWVAILVIVGIALGATGSYLLAMQDLNRMDDRLNALQQQITATTPATEARPDRREGS